MSEKLPPPHSSPENSRDLSKTLSVLRWLSPVKMWRVNNIRQERARLLNVLQRDNRERFLGPDRVYRILDYQGTEWRIVIEVLNGTTGVNPITGNLWSAVLLEMVTHLDIRRRAQIYAKLREVRAKKSFARGRIDRIMEGLKQVDSRVSQRAVDEDFFRENVINMQSGLIEDAFDKIF